MYYSGNACLSDDTSPEYQAWYMSESTGQNLQTKEPGVQVEGSWSPFLGTSQTLGHSFIPTTVNQEPSDNMTETYSNVFTQGSISPEHSWNYIYYMPLLSGTHPKDSEQDYEFPVTSSSPLPSMSPEDQLPKTPSGSSSLYSTMLKKGLTSLPTFLKTSEETHSSSYEQNSSMPNVRRNSYPNASSIPPYVLPPSVSMPLDPISLKGKSSKKAPRRAMGMTDAESQANLQEISESILNNSVDVSGNQTSKCTLNINNDFNKMTDNEKGSSPLPKVEEKCEPSEKSDIKRKPKPRPSSSAPSQSETCSNQDFVKKGRTKLVQGKTKGRPERGRHHRKRHSVPDTKEPSYLVNLVFQLQILIGQLPFQSLLVSLSESLVTLMGMAVGLLWVFAMLSYDWAQMLFYLVRDWTLLTYQWVYAHGGDFVSALFLRMPNIYNGSSNKKEKRDANEEFNLPKTGEEAVQRLLKFKETDPYSILGIPSDASDEDIKRSYKSQAILVHPDKNHFTGAEEAFKILASAFEILGSPESRTLYDREHVLTPPRSEANQEISDFLEKLKQNIEEAQSILGCQNCGKTHKRYRMDRTPLEARYCAACKDKHAAREGDLWAETSMMGFKWHYYSYLDGAIYDVTEWVTCQPNLVSRVEANTHWVPCRLAQPKNKNRSAAFSRMEDLKDLVNDLLNANQTGGPNGQQPAPPAQNGKVKTRRAAGGRRKK